MKFTNKKFVCTLKTPFNRYKPGVWKHPSTDRNGNCMICGTVVNVVDHDVAPWNTHGYEVVHHRGSIPNAQSMPKPIKALFIPTEGCTLMDIDVSELERKLCKAFGVPIELIKDEEPEPRCACGTWGSMVCEECRNG